MSEELKPCPCCDGTKSLFFYNYPTGAFAVCCVNCGMRGPATGYSKDGAITAWNALYHPLQWTAELPALTKFGYYWWKKERNVMPSIVYVTPVTSSRPLKDGEEDHPEVFFFSRSAPLDARTLGGYWAGPITEPMEAKDD